MGILLVFRCITAHCVGDVQIKPKNIILRPSNRAVLLVGLLLRYFSLLEAYSLFGMRGIMDKINYQPIIFIHGDSDLFFYILLDKWPSVWRRIGYADSNRRQTQMGPRVYAEGRCLVLVWE